MLKPTVMNVHQVPYLVEEATHDDYLSQQGETPGEWLGTGAKQLGLTGQVDGVVLSNLLKGMSPDGSVPLVQLKSIRKGYQHDAGTMLTVNMPKSATIVGALGDTWASRQTEDGLHAAVVKFVAHLEAHYAFTRRGRGGQRKERCSLTVACHIHHTNRNGECHWHAHLSIPHIAFRQDGSTGALVNRPFFDHQLELGAIFRGYLAVELSNRLGLKLEADGDSFRVVGVPREVEKAFSTRRAEIVADMQKRGVSGAKAAEESALATRKPKEHVPFHVLMERWRKTAAELGFGEAEIRALVKPHAYRENLPPTTLSDTPRYSTKSQSPELPVHERLGETNRGVNTDQRSKLVSIKRHDHREASDEPAEERGGPHMLREYIEASERRRKPSDAPHEVTVPKQQATKPEDRCFDPRRSAQRQHPSAHHYCDGSTSG